MTRIRTLALLLVILIGTVVYFLTRETEHRLVQETKCDITKSGWNCQFTNRTSVDEYQSKCDAQGGRWKCYGYCEPDYTHYCDLAFKDAGKACNDSTDCAGNCLADIAPIINQFSGRHPNEGVPCPNCTGTCSKYRIGACDSFAAELRNGSAYTISGALCD